MRGRPSLCIRLRSGSPAESRCNLVIEGAGTDTGTVTLHVTADGGNGLLLELRVRETADELPEIADRQADPSAPGTSAPRVFLSYAHDDERHADSVRAFGEFLTLCAIDVHMDRWALDRRRDWHHWAIEQIKCADFVLIIASPMCRLVGDGESGGAGHWGLQSELSVMRELLHSDRSAWLQKLLPVVLPHGSVGDIPLFLQPRTADHYLVREFTVIGAEDLLRAIFGQPPYRRPEHGSGQLILPLT
jgi:hypothetical protein